MSFILSAAAVLVFTWPLLWLASTGPWGEIGSILKIGLEVWLAYTAGRLLVAAVIDLGRLIERILPEHNRANRFLKRFI